MGNTDILLQNTSKKRPPKSFWSTPGSPSSGTYRENWRNCEPPWPTYFDVDKQRLNSKLLILTPKFESATLQMKFFFSHLSEGHLFILGAGLASL